MNHNEKLADIREHPEHHRHDFIALRQCCIVEGILHLDLLDAHEGTIGRTNGGVACDVTSGPCACSAWH